MEGYPKVIVRNGAKINAQEPLNDLYVPSMADTEFSRIGERVVADPSNALPGEARRSPAGFPYHYQRDGTGAVTARTIRHRETTSLADDNAVFEYENAIQRRNQDLARAGGGTLPTAPAAHFPTQEQYDRDHAPKKKPVKKTTKKPTKKTTKKTTKRR